MKTSRICIILFVSFLLVALLSAYMYPNQYAYHALTEDWQNMQNNIYLGKHDTEKEIQLAYADLFLKISKGSETERDQLAELVRSITNDAVTFDNSEVFTLAGDYARLFSSLAHGESELGIQDISITLKNELEAVVEISYLGEVRYGTKMIVAGKNWNNGEDLVPYDNELGRYLLEISFYDSALSSKFAEKYLHASVHDLGVSIPGSNSNFLLKGVYTAEHGYVIYIGSSVPFSVEPQMPITLNWPISSIVVELTSK